MQLTCGQVQHRVPPAACNLDQPVEHEAAVGDAAVRYDQAWPVGAQPAANGGSPTAPRCHRSTCRDKVKVEDPRSPSPATTTTEVALDRLQQSEHLGKRQDRFDGDDGIGEPPLPRSERCRRLHPRLRNDGQSGGR